MPPDAFFLWWLTMILFIIIFVLFGLYLFISKKYSNPYKLIFVFGKKGSGKSCYMVHEMLKHKKKGWTIYTDMKVKIPGVRIISNPNDLANFQPVSNSLICLDEIGLTWDNRDYKTNFSNKGLLEFFRLQRKFRVKLICNSQSFDVDKKVRLLTDSMILQSNFMNVISISRPILRQVTLTNPEFTGESKIVDAYKFSSIFNIKLYFMPKYFKYFESFEKPERAELPYVLADTLYNLTKPAPKVLNRLRKQTRKQDMTVDPQSPADLPSVIGTDHITTTIWSVMEDGR